MNSLQIRLVGVGAGATDPTGFELEFTTENSDGSRAAGAPTMPVVINAPERRRAPAPFEAIGTFDWAMLVHGEQSVTLHQEPLPVEGTAMITGKVAAMYDKGKAAVVVLESEATDTGGRAALLDDDVRVHPRRGWLGWRPRSERAAQRRARARARQDRVVRRPRTDQALLYRLNGDRNPLHSDPSFAKLAGFDEADPARPVHLRVHRSGAAARGVRQRPGTVQVDRGALLARR